MNHIVIPTHVDLIHPGDTGDKAIVTGGRPPLTEESTGRVVVAGGEYYPSVFDLKWVRK